MGTYNFKSVGVTQTTKKTQTQTPSPQPIGIITPPRQAPDGSLIQLSYSLSEQVGYNLRDLLMTNWGERLGLYDFGANLKPLCAEYQTQEDFDMNAMDRIRTSISRWMPYIDLEDYISEIIPQNSSVSYIPRQIKIKITYSVSQLNVEKKALEIMMIVL
jgi:phage baseplate assembly protein W